MSPRMPHGVLQWDSAATELHAYHFVIKGFVIKRALSGTDPVFEIEIIRIHRRCDHTALLHNHRDEAANVELTALPTLQRAALWV